MTLSIGESLNHLMQTAMTEVAGLYGTGGPGRFPGGADDVFEKAARSSKHLDGALGAAGKKFGGVADDLFSGAGSSIGRHSEDCFKHGSGCFVYDTEVARGWDVLESPIATGSAWDATWLTVGLSLAAGTSVALIVGEPRPSVPGRGSRRRGTAAPTFIPVAGDEPKPGPETDEICASLAAATVATSATDQLFAECDMLNLSTPAVPTMPIPQPPFPTAAPRRSWWAVPLLLLSALCLWNAVPAALSHSPFAPAPLSASSATPHKKLRTTPIGEIRLGMRVLAENPELAGQNLPDTPIDPATWRTIALTMTKPDGGRLDMEFIRSPEWREETGAQSVGDVIPLDLPELNVSGSATVTAIGQCPSLETGKGRLVTGRFTHNSADVLNLFVEGVHKPIGTTPNHLFWSEDRRKFIPAAELKHAELLKCADGICRAVMKLKPANATQVFNLEIDQEHAYGVGYHGVVVHNAYPSGNSAPSDGPSAKSVHDRFVEQVRPGAAERTFDTPWSSSTGLGSRRFDDFDDVTGTGFEGNTTPWSNMTQEQLSRKLDQVGSDFALIRTNSTVRRIVWFGTEELPTTGLGNQLRQALSQAGISYWVIQR